MLKKKFRPKIIIIPKAVTLKHVDKVIFLLFYVTLEPLIDMCLSILRFSYRFLSTKSDARSALTHMLSL